MGVHTDYHCANGDTRWWGDTGDHCTNGDPRWWGYTPIITVLMETPGGGVTHR